MNNDTIIRLEAINVVSNDELIINAMDSVQDGDMHRTKRAIIRLLASLPPAQPRKGKWIVDEKRFGHKEHHCNLCGAILEGDDWRWRNNYYCYHCGAKME